MGALRQHTTYFCNDLQLPFNTESEPEYTWTSPDGRTIIMAFLVRDDSPQDPIEDSEEGEFYQFNSRSIHYKGRPDDDAFKRIVRANPGRVFLHDGTGDCHGPGTVSCKVAAGPLEVKDTKDVVAKGGGRIDCAAVDMLGYAGGYYIVPEDVPVDRRRGYADAVLASYSNWCNGEVYGVMVWRWVNGEFDEESRNSECWGFNGYEYALEELKQLFDAEVSNQ